MGLGRVRKRRVKVVRHFGSPFNHTNIRRPREGLCIGCGIAALSSGTPGCGLGGIGINRNDGIPGIEEGMNCGDIGIAIGIGICI